MQDPRLAAFVSSFLFVGGAELAGASACIRLLPVYGDVSILASHFWAYLAMLTTGLIAIGLFLVGSNAFGGLLRTIRLLAASRLDLETAIEDALELELTRGGSKWPVSTAAAALAATVAVLGYWSVLIATMHPRSLML